MDWKKIHALGSSPYFFSLAEKCIPWLWVCFGLLMAYGLLGGLYLAPPDYQQGDAFRIIYIHVPSAFMSMSVFFFMALSSISFLIWRFKMADVIAKVIAPTGAMFTFLALVTGSIWGKPMWGTYWIWDARLTSELILLLLYIGIMALRSAIINPNKAAKACAILTIVGAVDLPIIHYSVYWWNTLHQGSTLLKLGKPSIAPQMLWPLLATLTAFFVYFVAVMLMRASNELIKRESTTRWVKKL